MTEVIFDGERQKIKIEHRGLTLFVDLIDVEFRKNRFWLAAFYENEGSKMQIEIALDLRDVVTRCPELIGRQLDKVIK